MATHRMASGMIALAAVRDGRGFLNDDKMDLEGHRMERLAAFASLLRGFGLARLPVL